MASIQWGAVFAPCTAHPPGLSLDFNEFATSLRFVAAISDDYISQRMAGGERAADFLDTP